MSDLIQEPPMLLLAEDNPDDAFLTLRALKKGGWTRGIVWVRDGEEAVEWFLGEGRHAGRPVAQQPRIALLDIHMPRLSGLEVMERIKADPRTRAVPVVIYTSHTQAQTAEAILRLGAAEFLIKPTDFVEYGRLVQALVGRWLGKTEAE